jgi:hypothetical protein
MLRSFKFPIGVGQIVRVPEGAIGESISINSDVENLEQLNLSLKEN